MIVKFKKATCQSLIESNVTKIIIKLKLKK